MIHLESNATNMIFFNEQHFLPEPKFAAQPDAPDQPNLDFATDWEAEPAPHFDRRPLAFSQPAIVTVVWPAGAEIQFILWIHPQTSCCK